MAPGGARLSCLVLAALRFHKRPERERRAARRCLSVDLGLVGVGEGDEDEDPATAAE